MYQYRVTADQVKIHGGKVQLDKEAAKKRLYGLKETAEPGIYEVHKTLYFANGLTFGHTEKITYGVECLNAEPVTAKPKVSHNVEMGVMLNDEGKKQREEFLRGQGFQENDSAGQGDSGAGADDKEPVTLKEISELLAHDTLKQTIELLQEDYDCALKKGADPLPEEVLKKVMADYNLSFEDEVDPNANPTD